MGETTRIYDPIRITQEESTNRSNESLMAMDDKIVNYVVGVVNGTLIHTSSDAEPVTIQETVVTESKDT